MKTTVLLTTLTLATLASSTALKSPRSTFTWTSWVDSLIADPAHAMSPEEAIAAFNTANPNPNPGLSTSGASTSDAALDKRQAFANCQQLSQRPPSVPDAVACINDLASRGNAGQECNVDGFTARVQCRLGSADVVSVRGRDDAPKSVNCVRVMMWTVC
ncbi:uncharacterized protein J4E79_005505 [Alternaria viburni]|uniref:uncharacterized protein n=1 Tax=Alternaria viburni TaxID=566460 RepID=UPI0020C4B976|nr:uncharacterized protein J4E79_005505 [Alternaria viburni]KAI4660937.1 hypothetical protein J4E79_005505 [Alternaria viburni]